MQYSVLCIKQFLLIYATVPHGWPHLGNLGFCFGVHSIQNLSSRTRKRILRKGPKSEYSQVQKVHFPNLVFNVSTHISQKSWNLELYNDHGIGRLSISSCESTKKQPQAIHDIHGHVPHRDNLRPTQTWHML